MRSDTPRSPGSRQTAFSTFISDSYETKSIIFTTKKKITEWAETMGDPVLTTAMLDRILHHAQCFSLKGESYRLKHPEMFTTTEQQVFVEIDYLTRRKNSLPLRRKNCLP